MAQFQGLLLALEEETAATLGSRFAPSKKGLVVEESVLKKCQLNPAASSRPDGKEAAMEIIPIIFVHAIVGVVGLLARALSGREFASQQALCNPCRTRTSRADLGERAQPLHIRLESLEIKFVVSDCTMFESLRGDSTCAHCWLRGSRTGHGGSRRTKQIAVQVAKTRL